MNTSVSNSSTSLPRFKLEDLYSSPTDQLLESDLALLEEQAKAFHHTFKGKLSSRLGDALEALIKITTLASKPFVYFSLKQSCDGANETIQKAHAQVRERWSQLQANYLNFFEHELTKTISHESLKALSMKDKRVAHHLSYLTKILEDARYLLSEEVERALTLRQPFGPAEWEDYLDELEARADFSAPVLLDRGLITKDEKVNLSKILHLALYHPESVMRFESMKVLNDGLKNQLAPVTTRALNVVLGQKRLEDSERGYAHSMSKRNLENKVSDAMVEALHRAVEQEGAPLALRYYRLLARVLGIKVLHWSDRTAQLPSKERDSIEWGDALSAVESSWRGFSPTMADFIPHMVESGWIDAPPMQGKRSGAFNYTALLPSPWGTRSFTFLNFQGSVRDVMTIAHEFGHAVHGMLAAEAQGPLMMHAPMAYAETASIFGEMLTFNHFLSHASSPERRLALLMEKCSDLINSVVRQISLSVFEQRTHELRRSGKLTMQDFCEVWMEITSRFYGKDGEVFQFEGMEFLWSYVSHFMSPFYVYAYAFGELLTQTIFSVRDRVGSSFEEKYLGLLRAGNTKDVKQLLLPFGLNPEDPQFWTDGLRGSLGQWLDQAEKLAKDLGY